MGCEVVKPYSDPDTLQYLYHERGWSTVEIGERFGVGHDAVVYHMEKHGIERRTPAEAANFDEGPVGESHGQSKLTESEVRSIRNLYDLGLSKRQLSDKYGVSGKTILQIVSGETWTHV